MIYWFTVTSINVNNFLRTKNGELGESSLNFGVWCEWNKSE